MAAVLSRKVDTELQAWHDIRIRSGLNASEMASPNASASNVSPSTQGSWWFDDVKLPISSKLFALLGLLVTRKRHRKTNALGDVEEMALMREYEERGRENHRAWIEP